MYEFKKTIVLYSTPKIRISGLSLRKGVSELRKFTIPIDPNSPMKSNPYNSQSQVIKEYS